MLILDNEVVKDLDELFEERTVVRGGEIPVTEKFSFMDKYMQHLWEKGYRRLDGRIPGSAYYRSVFSKLMQGSAKVVCHLRYGIVSVDIGGGMSVDITPKHWERKVDLSLKKDGVGLVWDSDVSLRYLDARLGKFISSGVTIRDTLADLEGKVCHYEM